MPEAVRQYLHTCHLCTRGASDVCMTVCVCGGGGCCMHTLCAQKRVPRYGVGIFWAALPPAAGGPSAMCFGCASFGAFSVAIEHFLES